jgi:hypothetical protein
MSVGSFDKTVTVPVLEPALSPLRAIMRAALDASIEALRDPARAPGLDAAARPGESAEQYAVRAVERTSHLVGQFGGEDEGACVLTAPRSILIAAIDAAIQGPHPSEALRALIGLRRAVMDAEEDDG